MKDLKLTLDIMDDAIHEPSLPRRCNLEITRKASSVTVKGKLKLRLVYASNMLV